MTYNAKTLGKCVQNLALLPQPLTIFTEQKWDVSGCYNTQTLYSGACKIKLFQRSPAQRLLLAWQALDLDFEVGMAGSGFSGKAEPPRWEMEDAFSLSPPLCSEPP